MKYFNKRGEIDLTLSEPLKLLIFIVLIFTFFSLLLQNRQFDVYHSMLDDMVRTHILKPMEEEGGFKEEMWADFQRELESRGIDRSKVTLVDATRYPVDRGEPVEVVVTSEYEIRALAYIGGPVLNRPTPIRKIGVSQRFFR